MVITHIAAFYLLDLANFTTEPAATSSRVSGSDLALNLNDASSFYVGDAPLFSALTMMRRD